MAAYDMEFYMPDPSLSPYTLTRAEKCAVMREEMEKLTRYHRVHCAPYAGMLEAVDFNAFPAAPAEDELYGLEKIPFIPVSLFKSLRLSSIDEKEDHKTVTSSGTSGQAVSKIVLDSKTRILQQNALALICADFLGKRRIPMLVIDREKTIRARDGYSARTSAVLGFSLAGKNRTFALSDDMSLDERALFAFLEKYGQEPFLVFGFTYIIWKYFYQEIRARGISPDLSGGILIHGGGWKKLEDQAVSKDEFKAALKDACGIKRVHNYYGMAEQTGSICMECECRHLHVSDYGAVIFRRPEDFSVCGIGETGMLQTMSYLAGSYPGHSLLTEDEGCLLGYDDCPCGRKGEYFMVKGRIRSAQARGCSDTFREIQT